MSEKSVLITGSSKGLGSCLAEEFALKEYDVIISGRNLKDLQETKKDVEKSGVECIALAGDINNNDVIEDLGKIAEEKNISILINNAGIYINKNFMETSYSELEKVMETNFFAQVKLTRRVLPIFLKKNSGLIININSIAGIRGSENEVAYSSSKHAFKGFSESLRYEVVKKGIRVTDVFLGAMNTQIIKGRKNEEMCIQPEEAAKLISNLSEEYSSLCANEIYIGRRKYD